MRGGASGKVKAKALVSGFMGFFHGTPKS
jgi:hypothetical protein